MLSQRSMQVQEEERRNLARELHDELGQSLNAIKVDAVTIRDTAGACPKSIRSAVAIIEVSNQVYDVVRSLMQAAAARWRWTNSACVPPCSTASSSGSAGMPACAASSTRRENSTISSERVNITLYRLVQECLTNVAKHADAGRSVDCLRDSATADARCVSSFGDDGKGFDPSQRKQRTRAGRAARASGGAGRRSSNWSARPAAACACQGGHSRQRGKANERGTRSGGAAWCWWTIMR